MKPRLMYNSPMLRKTAPILLLLASPLQAHEPWKIPSCDLAGLETIPTQESKRLTEEELSESVIAKLRYTDLMSALGSGDREPFSVDMLRAADSLLLLRDAHIRDAFHQFIGGNLRLQDYVTAVTAWSGLKDAPANPRIEILDKSEVAAYMLESSSNRFGKLPSLLNDDDIMFRFWIPISEANTSRFDLLNQVAGRMGWPFPQELRNSEKGSSMPMYLPSFSLFQKILDAEFGNQSVQLVPDIGPSSREDTIAMIANGRWPLMLNPPGITLPETIDRVVATHSSAIMHDALHAEYHSSVPDIYRRIALRGYFLLGGLVASDEFTLPNQATIHLEDLDIDAKPGRLRQLIIDGFVRSRIQAYGIGLTIADTIFYDFGPLRSEPTRLADRFRTWRLANKPGLSSLYIWDIVHNASWYQSSGIDPVHLLEDFGELGAAIARELR